ncbi:hypothetical protein CBR_g8891 [Chara braunii]|uniref:1-phosphatidylinositol-4-phosphate 5-kinase n=1 Tax=Chara braunii TaxID=69332 RepID=A0A388KN29_CHABU|nr:hypothetical protein CBR_g8891 [Chara braunii]|eukprot:GBG71474.1 hypothetical protein CBR_g8891 [Chara braunii]
MGKMGSKSGKVGAMKFGNGDIYTGSVRLGLPHGRGTYFWVDGSKYEGEWVRGEKEGRGMFVWPSGAFYDGEWFRGFMHGTGLYRGADDMWYKGSWSMGKKHGLGKKVFANKDAYEGLWRQGVAEGLGRYTWANGSEYVGEWKGGTMSGRGIFVWANRDRYDGEWEGGCEHGKGVFTWADGACYEGTWYRGLKHGKGFYYPPGCLKALRRDRHGNLVKVFADASAKEGKRYGRSHGEATKGDRNSERVSEGKDEATGVPGGKGGGVGRRPPVTPGRWLSMSGPLTEKERMLVVASARGFGESANGVGPGKPKFERKHIRMKPGRPKMKPKIQRQWSGPLKFSGKVGKDYRDMAFVRKGEDEEEGGQSEEHDDGIPLVGKGGYLGEMQEGEMAVELPSQSEGHGSNLAAEKAAAGVGVGDLNVAEKKVDGASVGGAEDDEEDDRGRAGLLLGEAQSETRRLVYDADSEGGKAPKGPKRSRLAARELAPQTMNGSEPKAVAPNANDKAGEELGYGGDHSSALVMFEGDRVQNKLSEAVTGALHGAERAITGAIHGATAAVSGAFLGATSACSGAGFAHVGQHSVELNLTNLEAFDKEQEASRECQRKEQGSVDALGHKRKVPKPKPKVFCREYDHGTLVMESMEEVVLTGQKRRGKKKKKKLQEIKRPGESIYKGHRSYDLMLSLQLGIRYAVGRIMQEVPRKIEDADFGYRAMVCQWFPKEGSRSTPRHQSTDFKWKDYCPMVFRHLREMFGIDAGEYMLSLCGSDALRELSSPGKSGSVFYLSNDDRFIIKTMKKAEMGVLLGMLPHYFRHVKTYENTLLTKFFGLHRIKPQGGRKVRFVVMGNMFSGLRIHRRYDLKGSSLGRHTETAMIDENTTLKDLDLHMVFQLEDGWRERLHFQLEVDCKFLEQQRIMDYSLLLGIHFCSRRNFVENPTDTNATSNGGPGDCATAFRLPAKALEPEGFAAGEPHSQQQQQGGDREEEDVHAVSVNGTTGEGDGDESASARAQTGDGEDDESIIKSGPLFILQPSLGSRNHRRSGERDRLGRRFYSTPLAGNGPVVARNGGTDALAFQLGRTQVQLGVNMAARAIGLTPDRQMDPRRRADVVVYFGIIDILQEYDLRKWAENAYKSMKFDSSSISAVDPLMYSHRFQEFMKNIFVGYRPYSPPP